MPANRGIFSAAITSVAVALMFAVSGCGAAVPSNQTLSPTPTTSVSPVAPTNIPTTSALQYSARNVGGTKLQVPTEWPETIVPGADKGFSVVTAPGSQTVGVTTINRTPVPVTEDLIGQTRETLQQANPNAKVDTKLASKELGEIIVDRDGTQTVGWIMTTNKATFLITVGPAYTVTSGKPKPQPTPSTFAPGTAVDQTLDMINRNLD